MKNQPLPTANYDLFLRGKIIVTNQPYSVCKLEMDARIGGSFDETDFEFREIKVTKLYDLTYRKGPIVTGAPYGVCVGKKNQLIGTGNYLSQNFEIKIHQS